MRSFIGGLYSSLLTAIAADNPKLLNCNTYNTWSVDFERGTRYLRQRGFGIESDTPWVRWVCRRVGTRHHYIILSPTDIIESLLDVQEARGIPGMPDSDASLLLLCREIQRISISCFRGIVQMKYLVHLLRQASILSREGNVFLGVQIWLKNFCL